MRFHPLLLIGSCLILLNGRDLQSATPSDSYSTSNIEQSALFVATNGNDGWSGRLAAPNQQRTDGPCATVERAMRAIRESRSHTSNVTERATILIRQGLYFLNEPLVLGPQDSGLLLSAYRNE